MFVDFLITVAGLIILVIGGDLMVRGASSLARRVGVSPLAIGLTVVAFGTSAPELAVNVTAAWRGAGGMSFGNIFGSNMANIGLVVALTALIRPLEIKSVVIRREMPMMMLATTAAVVMGFDLWLDGEPSVFTRTDGMVLLLLFTIFMYYTIADVLEQRQATRGAPYGGDFEDKDTELEALGEFVIRERTIAVSLALTVVGIAMLLIGARLTVLGAADLARAFGVSEAIIGLSLVAVGTSLPELVASIMATIRGQADLAIGNAVGSNVFNLLLVLGITSSIAPVEVPVGGVGDMLVATFLGLLLWAASATQTRTIIRAEAAVLLLLYLSYVSYRALS